MERNLFLSAAAVIALAACGGGEPQAGTAPAEAESATTETGLAVPEVFKAPLPEGEGQAYLDAFAALPGATKTESGLVIQVIEEGSGPTARANDLVRINFMARAAGGEAFESSYRTGSSAVVVPNDTLRGWGEALQLMNEGTKARIALPPELAFGAAGMRGGPVGPNEAVTFDIDVLDIVPADDPAALEALVREAEAEAQKYTEEAQRQQGLAALQLAAVTAATAARSELFIDAQAARDTTTTTPSGLVYEVVKAGPGEGESPAIGDTVKVHYRGTLPDGTEFDSSYSRGQPTEFELGRVIDGWNEGLQLMKPGDTYRLYIPAELAYGERGAGQVIGPNQALIFDVELLEVTKAESAPDDGE